jgi:probable addiction module antidote protein
MAQATGSTAGKRGKLGSYSSSEARNSRKPATLKRQKHIGPITKIAKTNKASVPYEPDLFRDLQTANYAKAYLTACLNDDHPGTFFVALRQVIQARDGIGEVAKKLNLNRPGLYRALSEKGNPSMTTVMAVLNILGLHFELC